MPSDVPKYGYIITGATIAPESHAGLFELLTKGETMKDIATEAAEAVKVAAEALGFTSNSDQYFTFVNSQFKTVFDNAVYQRQLQQQMANQQQAASA
jgi:hypothetical protein